ncbi:hypothetical protein CAL7716_103450 (plasmid) [Calothrix sp. PCC 7716]|nr:hypothetical protein CAL7716_103450 [Calothrix sp. PCC 7716]
MAPSASFALLTLVFSPSRAESRATNANTTTSKTEQQISQTPSSPTKQQSEDKGCPCCKKNDGQYAADGQQNASNDEQSTKPFQIGLQNNSGKDDLKYPCRYSVYFVINKIVILL